MNHDFSFPPWMHFAAAALVLAGIAFILWRPAATAPQPPICSEIGADVLRANGWKSFTPPDAEIVPILVARGKAELLHGHGEAVTLICHDPLHPEQSWQAVQRWYRMRRGT